MKNLVFSNELCMNAVVKRLPDLCETFEVHQKRKVISVPATVSKAKLEALVKEARFSVIDNL